VPAEALGSFLTRLSENSPGTISCAEKPTSKSTAAYYGTEKQTELLLPDEDRVLIFLPKWPCPLCHNHPEMLAEYRLVWKKRRYAVSCKTPGCPNELPSSYHDHSDHALDAWKMYCQLTKDR